MDKVNRAEKPVLEGMPVVVTGASGFIGRRLTAALCGSGADVTAVLRTRHEADEIRRLGARVAIGGLGNGAILADVLPGAEILFNFAYDMRAGGAENLAVFDAVLHNASQARVRRIVHASSVVVYDDWPNGKIDENSSVGMVDGDPYRQAKIAMESRLLDADFEAAILQPTIVYGSGSALWTDAPMARMRAGGVVLPDPVGRCPLVHVDDVVQAALKAAEFADLGREEFLINGADQPDWQRFFDGYGEVTGQGEVRLEPVGELLQRLGPDAGVGAASGPSAAARISAVLRRFLGRKRFEAIVATARNIRPKTGLTYPDRGSLDLYSAVPDISIERAKRRLGYAPTIDFKHGLREIVSALNEKK